MDKFSDVDEDYIRLGIYKYLLETVEYNYYVEYCLSGINFIAYGLGNDDKTRIENEAFALINCIKQISTVESVIHVLKWFSQEKHPHFYDDDNVLASVIASTVTLYRKEYKELFTSVLSFYL